MLKIGVPRPTIWEPLLYGSRTNKISDRRELYSRQLKVFYFTNNLVYLKLKYQNIDKRGLTSLISFLNEPHLTLEVLERSDRFFNFEVLQQK